MADSSNCMDTNNTIAAGANLLPQAGDYSSGNDASQTSRRKLVCGSRSLRVLRAAILVLIAAVVEVTISIMAQKTSTGDDRYDAPFLIVYINHSATGLSCLLVCMGILCLKRKTFRQLFLDAGFRSCGASVFTATWLGSLFFGFNVCWILAVSWTSLSIFTTISKSSCVFVFGLSFCVLGERVTLGKCVAVLLCVSGAILTSVGGETNMNTSTRLEGVLASFVFTFGYALFAVCWGYYLDNATPSVVLAFLGLVGSTGIILCLPVLIVLEFANVERLVVPTMHQAMGVASLAVASVINNFTLMTAVSLTSPLIMSIGQVLEIPLTAVFDFVAHGEVPTCVAAIGMAFVSIGFLLLLVEQSKDKS